MSLASEASRVTGAYFDFKEKIWPMVRAAMIERLGDEEWEIDYTFDSSFVHVDVEFPDKPPESYKLRWDQIQEDALRGL